MTAQWVNELNNFSGTERYYRITPDTVITDGAKFVADKGGAYWGCGKRLYCAWGESETEQCQLFMRADSRDAAKIAALLVFPNAKFFN